MKDFQEGREFTSTSRLKEKVSLLAEIVLLLKMSLHCLTVNVCKQKVLQSKQMETVHHIFKHLLG